MTDYDELVDRYIALWNETDGERRRVLIERTFAAGATYVDPLAASEGHTAIDAMVAAVQQQFPDYRFRRKGAVAAHHDRIRFSWELAPENGPVFVDGTDFAVIADGRMASVTGFLDREPGAAS